MLTIRRADQRGGGDHGWLNTRHTFSFADYFDERHMGFRALRVINDDTVAPGRGFGSHSHRDMEIVTYVLAGALSHADSMGNGSTMTPGDVQRMSAGRGVVHSEANASKTEPTHFLQLWVMPDVDGGEPGYEQRRFADDEKRGRLRLIASADGAAGSLRWGADAKLFAGRFANGEHAEHALAASHGAWVHVASGELLVNGERVRAGDGVAVEGETSLRFEGSSEGEVLLFDLA